MLELSFVPEVPRVPDLLVVLRAATLKHPWLMKVP